MNSWRNKWDAVVVGSGPNGLSAAITLAQNDLSVLVIEAEKHIGGGARSEELTLPGYTHDLCSAVHPLAQASRFFRSLPLQQHGLSWIHPPLPLAHPLGGNAAAVLLRSADETAEQFGRDANRYRALFAPLLRHWSKIEPVVLGPLRIPAHPLALLRFVNRARLPASKLARVFQSAELRALIAGAAAHSGLPLNRFPTAAIALVLMTAAHLFGWPIPAGGAQQISGALGSYFRSLGGTIVTGFRVRSLRELPPSRAVLLDVTPRQLLEIAGDNFPRAYVRKLRAYRYGPGVFKMDWALDGPIPWIADACRRAGTVHLGGTLENIEQSEKTVWEGGHPERPFVILAQPTVFDSQRAPRGKHVAWAYCHVPNGSEFDMSGRIERQIEQFAPGFRDRIIMRVSSPPKALESRNGNLIGGEINGGMQTLGQLFWRPTRNLYTTPLAGLFLCSSATPPGPGVHGMCGYFAAQRALRFLKIR